MLRYGLQAADLLDFDAGVIPASGTSMLPYAFTDKVNSELSASLSHVDEALMLFINPEEKMYEIEMLKESFAYPDIDLGDLDIEWL
jgi:hypothetical protein